MPTFKVSVKAHSASCGEVFLITGPTASTALRQAWIEQLETKEVRSISQPYPRFNGTAQGAPGNLVICHSGRIVKDYFTGTKVVFSDEIESIVEVPEVS